MGRKKLTDQQDNSADLARLQEENRLMRSTIEQMGKIDADKTASKYLNEVDAIRKRGTVKTERVLVREFTDHKNISLWTRDGKRIGPMHRDNALAALARFQEKGVYLSATQPTESQVAEYKESSEYKEKMRVYKAYRERQAKTKRKGEMEAILKKMADTYGLTMDKLVGVLSPKEVKSMAEGLKIAGVS